MEYFSIQGSCLISILIPLNFLIGDFILWLKENKVKKYMILIKLLILIIGMMVSFYFIKSNMDPYVPFVFMGGTILAVVQNSCIAKKQKISYETNEVIRFFRYVKVILGVIIILIPHNKIFFEMFLSECEYEVKKISCYIYTLWGLETIVFEGIRIYKEERRDAYE